ncbi:permease prefix domain 1-containing protein [Deinococcus sp. PESE-13]
MTAVTAPPPALQTYLRRATAGLPAARRQEVWDELEEHVYCRAEQLEWQGVDPDEALSRALAELGPPLRVSAGMNGVHNMPKLISIGGITALAVTAGLYALAGGGAKVLTLPVATQGPATPCVKTSKPQPELPLIRKQEYFNCYQDDAKTVPGTFVTLKTVKKTIEAVGGTATWQPDGTLDLTLGRVSIPFWANFRRNGEGYAEVRGLLSILVEHQLQASNVPVLLRGVDHPEVQVGDMLIRLSDVGGKSLGRGIYDDLTSSVLPDLYYDSQRHEVGFAYETHSSPEVGPAKPVTTPFKAGNVVAAFALSGKNVFQASTGVVNVKGQIRLYGPFEASPLQFVTDIHKLAPPKSGQPWPVLLVRLSNTPLNNLKSGIFLPRSAQ